MDADSSRRSVLRIHGLPLIDDLGDLADQIRLSHGLLWKFVRLTDRYYRFFELPKATGGVRLIAQPGRRLKATQAWILRNILDRLRVSPACKGFTRGQSIRDNALPHERANAILTLDIEDFFPSVTASQVYGVFRRVGYGRRAAGVLTSICTVKGCLPQGAPTSPKLANVVCFDLDSRLLGYVGKRGIVYTRYADDLTFSAMSARSLARARRTIEAIVRDEGFTLNRRKTRLMGPSRRRAVTGLVVGDQGVGIGRQSMRTIRARVCRWAHMNAGSERDTMESEVRGWLAFVRGVDSRRAEQLQQFILRLSARFPAKNLERLTRWKK